MPITLNHTIVPSRDKESSAKFFAKIFGLRYDGPAGHFAQVHVNPDLSFDWDNRDTFEPHHYAFLVGDEEFDTAFARISGGGIQFFADPGCQQPGQIYRSHGRRGTYFRDPDGHLMEILTPAA